MKKKVIQIIVIVLAFGGSGVVVYNGFFKNNNQEALQNSSPIIIGAAAGQSAENLPAPAIPIADSNSQNLLPFGDKLDYSILDKQHLQSSGYKPLPLNLNTDVGIPESRLIIPESSAQ